MLVKVGYVKSDTSVMMDYIPLLELPKSGCSSDGRTLVLGTRGRGFETLHSDHSTLKVSSAPIVETESTLNKLKVGIPNGNETGIRG